MSVLRLSELAHLTGGRLRGADVLFDGVSTDTRTLHAGNLFVATRLDGFDYDARSGERFEIPVGERIAAHRERRAQERARSRPRAQGGPAAAGRRAANCRSTSPARGG